MRENLLNENTQMFGLSTYNIYTNYTGLFTKRMQLEYTDVAYVHLVLTLRTYGLTN